MKIKHISIENFRGIKQLDLDLTNPLTGKILEMLVLSGPNGCGKTSVLESIFITLAKKRSKEDKAFMKNNERKNGSDYKIKIELVDNGGTAKVVNTKNTTTIPMPNDWGERKIKIEYYSSWREPKLFNTVSVKVGRRGNIHKDTEENRLINFKQLLVDSYTREKLAQESNGMIKDYSSMITKIEKALSLFNQGKPVKLEIKPIDNDIDGGFDVFVQFEGRNKDFISLDSLSSGEIEIFSFLSSVIRHDLKGGILLIDEPELHLHLSWHRIILQILREMLPDTQIITATHSLEILNSIKSYERVLLGEDEDYIQSCR